MDQSLQTREKFQFVAAIFTNPPFINAEGVEK